MKIYLIPGLAYDHRIFGNLDLGDHTIEYINWIEPQSNELLRNYTLRMFEKLPHESDSILIGHSFGGVVSQEIAMIKKLKKIILVSSIKSAKELPTTFRLIKTLNLYKLFTKEFSTNTIKYWGKDRGFRNEVDQNLFKSMIEEHSNNYLQWALKALCEWKEPELSRDLKLYQIHGSNDKTFPLKFIKQANMIIENGNHVMVYDRSKEISHILMKEIARE